jgi:LPXTG-site transpeptidase (sortase) family protein
MKQPEHLVAAARLGLSMILALSLTLLMNPGAGANEPATATAGPGRLIIPAIALDSAIIPVGWTPVVINGQMYGQWDTAKNEVGWHNLSANLGQSGNTVLAGHSDINTKIFRNLQDVDIGDEIVAISGVDGQPHHYAVTQKVLLQEAGVPLETRIKNAQWIAPTNDERLTLVTCSRPGATHRLIVVARPVGPPIP